MVLESTGFSPAHYIIVGPDKRTRLQQSSAQWKACDAGQPVCLARSKKARTPEWAARRVELPSPPLIGCTANAGEKMAADAVCSDVPSVATSPTCLIAHGIKLVHILRGFKKSE